jgi:thiol-disulfide isomerase/thioredoxin
MLGARGTLRTRSAAVTAAFLIAVAIMAVACRSGGPSAVCGSGPTLLPASPTALPTLDAKGFTQLLCQLRGKPVVVNIWASWCGPCIFEAPELAAAAAAHQGDVQFVGVDIQDQVSLGRAFLQKFHWTYPSVFDPKGEIRDSLGLIGAPHTLFFDANGVRTLVSSGPVTKEILSNGISGAIRHAGSTSGSPSGAIVPSPTSS